MASDPRQAAREDRRWTLLAAGVVGGFVVFSAVVAFIALPVIQSRGANIDAWTAICRAVGVLPGTPARPQPISVGVAAPVSQVSWAPRTLDILGRADVAPGAQVAAAVCSSCHGEKGVSTSADFPHLSGQSAAAIYKQLSDYRSGARVHPLMTPVAQQLTEEQLAQVAAYYAGGNAFGSLGTTSRLPNEAMKTLVDRGDAHRGIPACNSCHGTGVGGPIETPTLTGQQAEYLVAQLKAYRSGDRRNDVYRRMRDIAGRLSDDEIGQVAAFYQGLR